MIARPFPNLRLLRVFSLALMVVSSALWSPGVRAQGPPTCPCTLWDSITPDQAFDSRGPGQGQADSGDGGAIEVGVKFRSSINGYITGLRFYKSTLNIGTHVGNLWTTTGVLVGTATYTNETASGWQDVTFASPVAIAADTTYVASYHAPNGHYAFNANFFGTSGTINGPLTAPSAADAGGNNVYRYSPGSTFPDQPAPANYWIDVVFNTSVGNDSTPPTITTMTPAPNVSGFSTATNVTATFSETIDQSTLTDTTFRLRDGLNNAVIATLSFNPLIKQAVLDPTAGLAPLTTYTATVSGGASGVRIWLGIKWPPTLFGLSPPPTRHPRRPIRDQAGQFWLWPTHRCRSVATTRRSYVVRASTRSTSPISRWSPRPLWPATTSLSSRRRR